MQKLKRNLALLVATLASCFMLLTPIAVTHAATDCGADPNNSVCSACKGLELTGGSCDTAGGKNSLDDTIKLVINIFSLIIGLAAIIMIMVGGFRYITSGGDSGNVSGAKNTILYAIIGLVVVALAQILVKFVLNNVPK